MSKKNKNIKMKSVTLITAAIVASNGSLIFADNSDIKKDETVYSILDENGNIKENIVSTWIKSNSKLGEIKDISELKNIKNLKGDELPQIDGSDITWDIEGDDLYYSGESNKSLPIDMNIKYELDGKVVNASELENKSGKVKITISLKNREARSAEINGEERTVYVPFLAAVEVLMPRDNFKDIDVSSGTVVDEGKNCSITFVSVPGLKDSLELKKDLSDFVGLEEQLIIETNATNFKMPNIITVVSPNTFDVDDIEDLDENSSISDLKNSLGDLKQGGEDLLEGSKKLSDATSELNTKYKLFDNGVQSLDSGASELNAGVSELNNSTPALNEGAGELHGGLYELMTAQGLFTQGVQTLDGGAGKLDEGIKELTDSAPALIKGANDLNGGLGQLSEKQGEFSTGVSDLDSSIDGLSAGINNYIGGVSGLNESYNGINDGIAVALQMANNLGGQTTSTTSVDVSQVMNYTYSVQSLAQSIEGIASQIEANGDVGSAAQLRDISSQLYSVVGGQQSELNELSSGVTTHSESNGASELQAQLTGIMDKSNNFHSSLATLVDKGSTLSGGVSQLKQGTSKLNDSSTKLKVATDSVYQGSGTLLNGVNKLSTGGIKLKEGSSELKSGTMELSENATKLNTATGAIYNGSESLLDATAKLNAGTNKLADGSQTLKKGTAELSINSTKILSGTKDLSSGAKELYAGTDKLKTEGLDKLYDVGNEKLGDINGILEAKDRIIEISKDYNNYGGINEDMQGNVKFIMKVDNDSTTDEDTTDTKKENIVEEEKDNGGFVNWVKGLFK